VLEEFVEECLRFIRDADDLVRCLTIEFEIELGSGLAVIPGTELFEIVPSQRALRERGASDGEADTRCLPGDAVLLRDRFGGSDNAPRDEPLPAFVLAREHENRVTFGDMLTAIHRLLRGQRERLRPWIANLGFNRERHAKGANRTQAGSLCYNYAVASSLWVAVKTVLTFPNLVPFNPGLGFPVPSGQETTQFRIFPISLGSVRRAY
jgi:hypothetical protein